MRLQKTAGYFLQSSRQLVCVYCCDVLTILSIAAKLYIHKYTEGFMVIVDVYKGYIEILLYLEISICENISIFLLTYAHGT